MQRFLVLVFLLLLPSAVQAGPPVVIEFFGKNNCTDDVAAQEALQEILKTQDEVYLINCRTLPEKEEYTRAFSYQFCEDRAKSYARKFQTAVHYSLTWMLVNGKWDANFREINPAVKLGRTDGVGKIPMTLRDDVLHISIPEIKSKSGHGEMLLYAFAPSTGNQSIFVDPDVTLTDKMEEDLRQNRSVPFVTKARTSQLYVRPVMAIEHLGPWQGKKTEITFPVKDMTPMAGSYYADLSYVLVLHDGDTYGEVLGVGEVLSLKERYNTLPHTEPLNIELRSFNKEELPLQ